MHERVSARNGTPRDATQRLNELAEQIEQKSLRSRPSRASPDDVSAVHIA